MPPPSDITIVVPPVTQELKGEYRNATQIDKTELPVDNKFAKELVKTIGLNGLLPINIEPICLGGTSKRRTFLSCSFISKIHGQSLKACRYGDNGIKCREYSACVQVQGSQGTINPIATTINY
jgi:hypothetical protein